MEYVYIFQLHRWKVTMNAMISTIYVRKLRSAKDVCEMSV